MPSCIRCHRRGLVLKDKKGHILRIDIKYGTTHIEMSVSAIACVGNVNKCTGKLVSILLLAYIFISSRLLVK